MAGTPKSELPEGWRELATRGVKRDPLRNFEARAKVFLDRIAHLSADLDSHGHTRANALKKLRRICEAEARRLKASPHPGHRQVLPLKVPRRHPPDRPKPRGLAPQKNALRPALQLPCASPDAQIGAGATAYLILVTLCCRTSSWFSGGEDFGIYPQSITAHGIDFEHSASSRGYGR